MIAPFLPQTLMVVITWVTMAIVLLVFFIPFPVLALLRLFAPVASWRVKLTQMMIACASAWVGANKRLYRILFPVNWQITGDIDALNVLETDRSFLLISNHQSWIDILVLFDQFHRKTPFARFFLKFELIWVPIIGFVCWAMEFPFMKRHTPEKLAKNPNLRNEDLETTRLACERFKLTPVTIVNFLEGTRFTEQKRISKGAPFKNLLRPKSAGIAFALHAMGDQFAAVLDVSIVYGDSATHNPKNRMWAFLSGRQKDIVLHLRRLDPPEDATRCDYQDDPEFRARFQSWLNGVWEEKDQIISEVKQQLKVV